MLKFTIFALFGILAMEAEARHPVLMYFAYILAGLILLDTCIFSGSSLTGLGTTTFQPTQLQIWTRS